MIFILLTVLLFSSQKSCAGTDFLNHNKLEHITKTPISTPHQILNDILVNLDDDDDEASSKTKYKLSKAIVFFKHKSNHSKQDLIINGSPFRNLTSFASVTHFNWFLHSKTSISIAICCLRI